MRHYILVLMAIQHLSMVQGYARDNLNEQFIQSAARAKPSVVFITSYKNNGSTYQQSGYGTGTIVTSSGYLVTNYHVVRDSSMYQATMHDGSNCTFTRFKNGLYYIADPETDLAVMKLQANGTVFNPIPVGKAQNLKEGEWVIAVGNPYGLSNSITSGIVSSTNRTDVGFTDIEDFIQTDVPINPGNSGGPLINLDGEMVGINTAIRTVSGGYQGISFSIPSEIVKKVFDDLIKYGYVRRGWVGILVKEESGNTPGRKKIRIVSVLKNSPAETLGIKAGDIIREADDKILVSKSQLLKIVKSKQIGSHLSFSIQRGSKVKSFSITMREKQHYQKVGSILQSLRKLYGIELDLNAADDTIVVSNVSPLLLHTHSNLIKQGDIVKAINGHSIYSIEDFAVVFKQEKYSLKTIHVLRDNHTFIIEIVK